MSPHRRARAACLRTLSAVLWPLILVACGGSSSSTPRASASPSQVTTAAFTTKIPTGWIDHTADQKAVSELNIAGTVQMLLYAPPTTAQIHNEHIDVSTVSDTVPDDQLASYLESVTQNGATDTSQPQPFNLAGATGLFITYHLMATGTQPPVQLKSQEMIVNHTGETYEIVLNTASVDFDGQLPALKEVLQSWRWTTSP